ncbi:hypothetical protein O6H91_05G036300 [Diphasiastrum complanatum]|nr:hypothetical protein O6H91_05G036300 [Diphasiastrum complanatum]KAJ7555410.1 hypothetical protein O6H91_05G036300 [Diphasiastrum complanatum]
MEKAEMFHKELDAVFGNAPLAEPFLWMISITVGITFCIIVYEVMRIISPIYSYSYNKLSKQDQVEWNNRGFSTAHALLVTVVSGYLLLFSNLFSDTAPYGQVVFRSTIFSQFILGVSTGYFLYDLYLIIAHYPALGRLEFVFHHIFSLAALLLALHSGYAHIYLYMILFTESTTPFVNIRWYLSAIGLKRSNAYVVNGLMLFLVWLVARVLIFVYFFSHIYLHFDQVRQLHSAGFYFLFITPPLLAIMNLFWFGKIVNGLVKALIKKS